MLASIGFKKGRLALAEDKLIFILLIFFIQSLSWQRWQQNLACYKFLERKSSFIIARKETSAQRNLKTSSALIHFENKDKIKSEILMRSSCKETRLKITLTFLTMKEYEPTVHMIYRLSRDFQNSNQEAIGLQIAEDWSVYNLKLETKKLPQFRDKTPCYWAEPLRDLSWYVCFKIASKEN